jgi:hypothetical protein
MSIKVILKGGELQLYPGPLMPFLFLSPRVELLIMFSDGVLRPLLSRCLYKTLPLKCTALADFYS